MSSRQRVKFCADIEDATNTTSRQTAGGGAVSTTPSASSALVPRRTGATGYLPDDDQTDANTDPCPTPDSDAAFEGVAPLPPPYSHDPSATERSDSRVRCADCDTSLFTYRHRILTLERDLAWQKQCLELLVNVNERKKRDSLDLHRQLVRENHALKLGVMGIPEHVADIDKNRIVSMVQAAPRSVGQEHQVLCLTEQLRRATADKHRGQAAHNALSRSLRHQVATLQNTVATQSKSYDDELETLRCRLNRLRRGARAQELREVAGAARSLRGSVNRLRASFTDLRDSGPLSAPSVLQIIGQVRDAAAEISLGGGGSGAISMAGSSGSILAATPAGAGASSAPASASASAMLGGTTPVIATPSSLVIGSGILGPSMLLGSGPSAAEALVMLHGQQQPPRAADTNCKDLAASLVNYWSGFDDDATLMQALARTLAEKMQPQPAAAAGASPRSPAAPPPTTELQPAAAGGETAQQQPEATTPAADDEEERPPVTPQQESDLCRSALYKTVTMLTEGVAEVYEELAKEKHKVADLQRHLASFKMQLKAARDGHRPECDDKDTQCYAEEFEESTEQNTDTCDDSRSRRGSEFTGPNSLSRPDSRTSQRHGASGRYAASGSSAYGLQLTAGAMARHSSSQSHRGLSSTRSRAGSVTSNESRLSTWSRHYGSTSAAAGGGAASSARRGSAGRRSTLSARGRGAEARRRAASSAATSTPGGDTPSSAKSSRASSPPSPKDTPRKTARSRSTAIDSPPQKSSGGGGAGGAGGGAKRRSTVTATSAASTPRKKSRGKKNSIAVPAVSETAQPEQAEGMHPPIRPDSALSSRSSQCTSTSLLPDRRASTPGSDAPPATARAGSSALAPHPPTARK